MQHKVKLEMANGRYKADTRHNYFEEGETDLHRLVRQRDRDGKDMQQARVIRDGDGNVLTGDSWWEDEKSTLNS